MAATAGVLVVGQFLVPPAEPAALGDLNNQALVTGVENQVEILAEEARIAAAEEEARRIAAEEEARRIAAEEEAARLAAEEAARQAEEEARKAANTPTNDRGIADSAYTGEYYNSGYEGTRKCIVRKESGGNYGIVSSNGLYHGAYQFSSGTGNNAARKMGRSDLVGIPASRWSRYEQDMAFWVTWNNGAGRGHWPTANGC